MDHEGSHDRPPIVLNVLVKGGRDVDGQEGVRGRRLCDAAIELLDGFSFECARFCQAATRARIAAADGWKALEGTLDASRRPSSQ